MSFELKRKRLVEGLVREGILRGENVIRAMLKVPRECFVLKEYKEWAYIDSPLPILCDQTISAPHMCAIMCEALELSIGMRVLEIGTGSGYHAALCAEIVAPTGDRSDGFVVTVEYFTELAKFAEENLKKTGYSDRVYVVNADGSEGVGSREQFDRVLVTAAAPTVPRPLLDVLKPQGLLVIPVGTRFSQVLLRVKKRANGDFTVENLGSCVFVSLRGRYGFEY